VDRIRDKTIHERVFFVPRIARQKPEGAIFHVMSRSISEVNLFKTDEDKTKYLMLIKEYQRIYSFKVYAYCIMDNHVHLILDPNGADISKIMHCINFSYAGYFNAVHKRRGHLFQGRFKSKVVTDERYLITLSAYIHNNPLNIKGYENNPENYNYSSLAVYLGMRKDEYHIVEKKFILNHFDKDNNKALRRYLGLVLKTKTFLIDEITKAEIEFEEEKSEYRSERKILVRNYNIEDVVNYLVEKFQIEKALFYLKNQKKIVPMKGILVLLLRNLCNAQCKDICSLLGNITSSRVSKLSSIGVELVYNDERYKNVINDFIACGCNS
jgi:putative transposase